MHVVRVSYLAQHSLAWLGLASQRMCVSVCVCVREHSQWFFIWVAIFSGVTYCFFCPLRTLTLNVCSFNNASGKLNIFLNNHPSICGLYISCPSHVQAPEHVAQLYKPRFLFPLSQIHVILSFCMCKNNAQ